MKRHRHFRLLIACFCLGSQLPADAWGQGYPARPVRYLLPSSPGGGPALTSIVAGESSVFFAPYPPAKPHIDAGRLRALAVTSSKRLPALPRYPTVAESGVAGYESNNWYGLMVPAKTPKAVVTKLHGAVVSIVNRPEVHKRLGSLGYVPVGNRPEEYAAMVKSEIAVHAKLIRQTGLAPR